MRPDQERVHRLLSDTVSLLCKNGLEYQTELRIEGVIGVTIDRGDVFLVHVNESIGLGGTENEVPTPIGDGSINATTLSQLPGIVSRYSYGRTTPRIGAKSVDGTASSRRLAANRIRRGRSLLNRRPIQPIRDKGLARTPSTIADQALQERLTSDVQVVNEKNITDFVADEVKLEPTSPDQDSKGCQITNVTLDDVAEGDLDCFIGDSNGTEQASAQSQQEALPIVTMDTDYPNTNSSDMSNTVSATSSHDWTAPPVMSMSYSMESHVKQEHIINDTTQSHPTHEQSDIDISIAPQPGLSTAATPTWTQTPQKPHASSAQKRSSETNTVLHLCPLCRIHFTTKKDFHDHLKHIHGAKSTFTCVFCGSRFAHSASLAVHMRKHTGEQKFTCEICHKKFLYLDHYVGHMNKHSGLKPYQCNKCKKSYGCKSALRGHMKKCCPEHDTTARNTADGAVERKYSHIARDIKFVPGLAIPGVPSLAMPSGVGLSGIGIPSAGVSSLSVPNIMIPPAAGGHVAETKYASTAGFRNPATT